MVRCWRRQREELTQNAECSWRPGEHREQTVFPPCRLPPKWRWKILKVDHRGVKKAPAISARTTLSATPSQLQGKSYKLPQIHSNKDCRGFHRTGRHHQIRMKYLPRLTCLSLGLLTRKVNCHKRTHFTFVQKLPPLVIFKWMTMRKKKLPKRNRCESQQERVDDRKHQEDKLNSGCDSWERDEVFATTWHQRWIVQ